MNIHIKNALHVIDPELIADSTDDLAETIKMSILELHSHELPSMLGIDFDKLQVRRYGTLQVWELAIPVKPYQREQWFWTFFLFTEHDQNEASGSEFIDTVLAACSMEHSEDFDTFASRSHRQDLHVFPDAARRLAMAIPPSVNAELLQGSAQ